MTNSRYVSLGFAALLAVGIVLWFATGQESAHAPGMESEVAMGLAPAEQPMIVEAALIAAERVTREARLQGHTAPNRQAVIRAETAGRVDALLVERGANLSTGQSVVKLALDDRPAQRRKSAALLVQRENDHAAIVKLADQGHLPRTRVDEALANLESARAELAAVERDIENTTLRAPFDAVLNEREIELGDYVGVRDPVFTVVDNDPLIVVANVAQRDYGALSIGTQSSVRLVTGEQAEGRIRYLSALADEATRTFRVEIELANPRGLLPAGVSAEASIPTREIVAHRISPGWLVRTTQGEVGVYLADGGVAEFRPVTIVRSSGDAVWVAGLPESARVVTSGQGFLEDGRRIALTSADRVSERSADTAADRIASAPADGAVR